MRRNPVVIYYVVHCSYGPTTASNIPTRPWSVTRNGGVVDILVDLVITQPRVTEYDLRHCRQRHRRSNRLIGGVCQVPVGGRLRSRRLRQRLGDRLELEEPRRVEGDGRDDDDDDRVAQPTTADAVCSQRRAYGQIALGRDEQDTSQRCNLHPGGSVVAVAVWNWSVGCLKCRLYTM